LRREGALAAPKSQQNTTHLTVYVCFVFDALVECEIEERRKVENVKENPKIRKIRELSAPRKQRERATQAHTPQKTTMCGEDYSCGTAV
jgi:hypothetical protein